MSFYTGRLTEITLKNGLLAGRLTCPAKAVPAAGQYLLGQRVDQTGDILPAVLFLGQKDEDGFWAAPPLPSAWQPGLELNLRGPFGRGFQLPAYARHVALAALASTPDRLLPLAVQALASGREVTLFCDLTESSLLLDLPAEVEVDALAAFPAALPWADVVAEYVRVLRDLAAIAGEFGVRLSFEFLGFGWCSVRTPRAAFEIVQATERANVGLTVDAAHFYGGGGLLAELDALDPARIFAFHLDDLEDSPKEAITDATRVLPGLGVVPLAAICARLRAIGYDGPCSIELFRPEYWGWDPYRLAVQARAAAVRVLKPHFAVA